MRVYSKSTSIFDESLSSFIIIKCPLEAAKTSELFALHHAQMKVKLQSDFIASASFEKIINSDESAGMLSNTTGAFPKMKNSKTNEMSWLLKIINFHLFLFYSSALKIPSELKGCLTVLVEFPAKIRSDSHLCPPSLYADNDDNAAKHHQSADQQHILITVHTVFPFQ
jgi:hypothetical protein